MMDKLTGYVRIGFLNAKGIPPNSYEILAKSSDLNQQLFEIVVYGRSVIQPNIILRKRPGFKEISKRWDNEI